MNKHPYKSRAIHNNEHCCFQLFYGSFDRLPLFSGFFFNWEFLISHFPSRYTKLHEKIIWTIGSQSRAIMAPVKFLSLLTFNTAGR